jgi:MFS family permease
MRERIRVVLTVARDRRLARISIAYLGYTMAEHGTWVAILVYAYGLGGAGFAALVALVQLVPAGFVAPFAAYAGDRYSHDRVLLGGYVIQAATLGATAVALSYGAPPVVTIAAATLAAAAMTITRPAQAVILPAITHSAADLTAANAVSGLVEAIALFLGPLVAGLLLAAAHPGAAFAAFAALSLVNALLVARLDIDAGATVRRPAAAAREILAESFGGFALLRRDRDVFVLVTLLTASTVVIGALDILYVAVAIDLFAAGDSWAGFLLSGFGVGAVGGALGAVVLVGRRRLTPPFATSGTLHGVAIAAVAAVPSIFLAAIALAVSGVGSMLNAVAGRTLLQRVAPEAILGRVFGVLEGLSMFGLAVGSVATGLLIEAFDVKVAVVVAGLMLPVLLALTWRRLGAVDRHARAPDPEALGLLRSLPIFSPLSAPAIERILGDLEWQSFPAGHVLIREGDAGDRFYVVAEGRVLATREGATLSERGVGEPLGEIALLRDVPRTATVTAVTPIRLIAIERERFLEAVTGHATSRASAEAVADERLSVTPR